jgi:uncharacterized protein (TIGR03083 family)
VTGVEFSARVDALQGEGHALATAARAAGVDAVVPSCPEWRVEELVGHIGRIHRWVTRILVERSDARGEHWSAATPPDATAILDWFAAGVDPLADALRAAGPDLELWTWTADQSSGFWARRMAVETAIHRYDAQLAAAAAADPVGRELAVDGIDEFFWLVPFWPWAERVRGAGETIHLHATDGDGEWLVRLTPEGVDVSREHAKGDVAARGAASDLLLFLYGRVPAGELEVFGDASLLARWRELVTW